MIRSCIRALNLKSGLCHTCSENWLKSLSFSSAWFPHLYKDMKLTRVLRGFNELLGVKSSNTVPGTEKVLSSVLFIQRTLITGCLGAFGERQVFKIIIIVIKLCYSLDIKVFCLFFGEFPVHILCPFPYCLLCLGLICKSSWLLRT